MTFLDYFDAIFVINLDRRKDRWQECVAEFQTAGIPIERVVRWSAHENKQNPQSAGTHSHRAVMRHIVDNKIERALVFEDDFCALTRECLKSAGFIESQQVWKTHCKILNGYGTFAQRFEKMIPYLPSSYDLVFLAGGYAEAPISRVNEFVVRCGRMKCTSTLGVTLEFAKYFSERMDSETGGDIDFNIGAADDFLSMWAHERQFYCLQPRLLYQRKSRSDLTGREDNYLFSMTDPVHENMV